MEETGINLCFAIGHWEEAPTISRKSCICFAASLTPAYENVDVGEAVQKFLAKIWTRQFCSEVRSVRGCLEAVPTAG
jgi:hypothetical protein